MSEAPAMRTIAYRYQALPTPEQQRRIEAFLQFACDLYNATLQQWRDGWSRAWRWWDGALYQRLVDEGADPKVAERKAWTWRQGVQVSRYAQSREFTAWRQQYPDDWPAGMPSLVQREVLARVEKAFRAFFRGAGYPRWQRRRDYESLTFQLTTPSRAGKVTVGAGVLRDGELTLTGLGRLRLRWHRPLPEGSIARQAVVRRRNGRWFVSLSLDVPRPPLPASANAPGPVAAIDMGVWQWATVWSPDAAAVEACAEDLDRILQRAGHPEDAPWTEVADDGHALLIRGPYPGGPTVPDEEAPESQTARWQRHLSATQRGSHRRARVRARLARAYDKEVQTRADHARKVASVLCRHFGRIVLEDLDIAGMVKDAADTPWEHGLRRRLLAQRWYGFRQALEHRAATTPAQVEVLKRPAAGTTTRCSSCGAHVPKAPTDRVHSCESCGYVAPRPVNSARNLLALGERRLAS